MTLWLCGLCQTFRLEACIFPHACTQTFSNCSVDAQPTLPPLGMKRESVQGQEAERESDSALSAVSHLGVSLWFRPGAQISSGHNRDSY